MCSRHCEEPAGLTRGEEAIQGFVGEPLIGSETAPWVPAQFAKSTTTREWYSLAFCGISKLKGFSQGTGATLMARLRTRLITLSARRYETRYSACGALLDEFTPEQFPPKTW